MLQWRLTTKNVTIHRVTLWLITIRLGASSGEGGLTGTITMQDQGQALVLLFSLRVLIAILDTVGKITVSRTVSWMESSFVYYSLWWPFPFNISDKICAYLWLLKFRSWGVDVYNVTKLDQHPTLHSLTFIPSSLDTSAPIPVLWIWASLHQIFSIKIYNIWCSLLYKLDYPDICGIRYFPRMEKKHPPPAITL